MGTLTRRLFGFLFPERELDVEPRDHPYYPGETLETDEALLNNNPGSDDA